MQCSAITYSRHALQRMFQRGLSVADVESIVRTGLVIEDYPTDFPYPSSLLLGYAQGLPAHIAAASA